MGQGNNISTVETMYNLMTDSPRAFLHASLWYPHPDPKKEEDKKGMRMMIFGNPSLFGLLEELPGVDMFINATFSCCSYPFKQCLIVMVYDHSTRSYVPVLYILMTHKFEHLYKVAFAHVIALSDWKIGVEPLLIPPLPAAYLQFKQDMVSQSQSKKKKVSTKKTKKATVVGTTTDSTTDEEGSCCEEVDCIHITFRTKFILTRFDDKDEFVLLLDDSNSNPNTINILFILF